MTNLVRQRLHYVFRTVMLNNVIHGLSYKKDFLSMHTSVMKCDVIRQDHNKTSFGMAAFSNSAVQPPFDI